MAEYTINFLDSEGVLVKTITDTFYNVDSLIFFCEAMIELYKDEICDYVVF